MNPSIWVRCEGNSELKTPQVAVDTKGLSACVLFILVTCNLITQDWMGKHTRQKTRYAGYYVHNFFLPRKP